MHNTCFLRIWCNVVEDIENPTCLGGCLGLRLRAPPFSVKPAGAAKARGRWGLQYRHSWIGLRRSENGTLTAPSLLPRTQNHNKWINQRKLTSVNHSQQTAPIQCSVPCWDGSAPEWRQICVLRWCHIRNSYNLWHAAEVTEQNRTTPNLCRKVMSQHKEQSFSTSLVFATIPQCDRTPWTLCTTPREPPIWEWKKQNPTTLCFAVQSQAPSEVFLLREWVCAIGRTNLWSVTSRPKHHNRWRQREELLLKTQAATIQRSVSCWDRERRSDGTKPYNNA